MLRKTIFLIPGTYPKAVRTLFDAIKTSLKTNYQIVELETADENTLLSNAKKTELKILVGKSLWIPSRNDPKPKNPKTYRF